MSDRSRKTDRRERRQRGRGARVPWWVASALVLAAAVVVLVRVSDVGRGKEGIGPKPSGLEQVGPLEVSAMRIELGKVPLDRWVSPTFRLRNISDGPVTITVPREGVETPEGC